jgi:Type II CAAX prenyl endopeptidase Rce1-like
MASQSYFNSTRHPWPSLLFLLPLLGAYEGGVLWLGGNQPDALRNGADAWMRWALDNAGVQIAHAPPALVGLFFVVWSIVRRKDRPKDTLGTVSGMAIETVLFALGLWGISRGLSPLLESLGIKLATNLGNAESVSQSVTFVGAGIYEEVLFRLILFSLLRFLMQLAFLPNLVAMPIAAIASAAAFAAAHHLGPYGEPFDPYVFLFRSLAGLYFAIVFYWRGFGVAAGAHALYDVVVGVAMG